MQSFIQFFSSLTIQTFFKSHTKKHHIQPATWLIFVGFSCFLSTAWATNDNLANKLDTDDSDQALSQINATPHELAFLQVLSELCPTMLNARQKQQFHEAYNEQLSSFLPNLNTNATMLQISSQNEYKRALKWARSWTKTFPESENRALCVEFAESAP